MRPPIAYPGGNGKSIAVGDLNLDGRNDIAVTQNDGVGIFYQNGSGGFDAMVSHGYGESIDTYSFHDENAGLVILYGNSGRSAP